MLTVKGWVALALLGLALWTRGSTGLLLAILLGCVLIDPHPWRLPRWRRRRRHLPWR